MEPLPRLSSSLAAHYRIERELGAGGMANVYLAHDVRHDRRVALKVLRPELAAVIGAERFLQEIKVTANLQHPHILPLHDSGQVDGTVFYVMPYVEGESLRARLLRETQLPVDVAVRLTTEVASALDYAHRRGVIHRDIKPENILLQDGTALVADFGIALAVSTAGGNRMTETGLSLGTPHYMSPEQATGEREITPRSDIYALGCVLYEMLLGEPPFTGPTTQAIIARVMTEEPRSPTLQRKSIPPHVERALLKALEKLPADRFESAAQFSDALSGSGAAISAAIRSVVAPARRRVVAPASLAVAVALVLLGIIGGRLSKGTVSSGGVPSRLAITIPQEHRLSAATTGSLALSPDGTLLVYVAENAAGSQLYLRRLDDLASTAIPGTTGATFPTFSPDSRSIAFFGGSGLLRTSLSGGTTVKVAAPSGMLSALWTGPDEFTVTTADGSLGRLKSDGSVVHIASPSAAHGEGALLPKDVLPDGTIIAVAATQSLAGPLFAINPSTGARQEISRTSATAAHYDDGTLYWSEAQGTAGALLSAPMDARTHKLGAGITSVAPDVLVSAGGMTHVAFSHQGVFVYAPSLPSELVMVDRAGRAQPIVPIQRRFHHPRVSPDGRRVLVDFVEQSDRDVRVLELRDQTLRRLTFEKDGHDGSWLPSGDRILYASARSGTIGVLGRRADGSGTADSVLVLSGKTLTVHAVTPDGKQAIGVLSQLAGASGANNDIVTVSLDGERKLTPLLAATYSEGWPALSPNGRWLAYASDESGRFEVYVRPFPGPGGQVLVSKNGGSEPMWSRNGRELFFRALGGTEPMMVSATIEEGPEPRVTARTELFSAADYQVATPHSNFDVTPDGHFIMVRQPHVNELVLVQNWKEMVRRQAEAAKR